MTDEDAPIRIDASEALETMRLRSGKSMGEIGRDLGRYRTWYRNISMHDDMYLSSLLAVAKVTGHDVALLDHATGDVIALLEPPASDGQSDAQSAGETR